MPQTASLLAHHFDDQATLPPLTQDILPANGFSAATLRLTALSLSKTQAPDNWTYAPHDYSRVECFVSQDIRELHIVRSDRKAWAVGNTRYRESVIAELLISRLAALAQLPVAPVFLHGPVTCKNQFNTLSVIPFTHVIRGRNLPLNHMPHFKNHYSRMLPFMLWMGDDMDRHEGNLCMNADKHSQFAEYDFDSISITTLLENREADVPENFARVRRHNFHIAQEPEIMAADFHLGLAAITQVTNARVSTVLDMIARDVPFSADDRDMVMDYVVARRDALERSVCQGHFDRLFSDDTGEDDTTYTLPGVSTPASLAAFRYRFC